MPVAEALRREPEVSGIACVSLTETAAEKLVALTRRTAMRIAGLSRDDDPALIRHLYDLHVLRAHYDASTVTDLAREIIRRDADIFVYQYPAYHDDSAGETRKAVSALTDDPIYAERYERFHGNMVYRDPVAFSDALETLRRLTFSL